MSLTQRTEMRPCGRHFPTEEEAASHKLALSGQKVPVRCGLHAGWRLKKVKAAQPAKRSTPKDTGPSRSTRSAVLQRDGYRCVRCGKPCGPGIGSYSVQHRIARGVGGGNAMSSLLLLCGSATTGCHGEVESKADRHDNAAGYWLESWQDPKAEGVMYAEPGGSGITRWLDDDGSLLNEPPGRAA